MNQQQIEVLYPNGSYEIVFGRNLYAQFRQLANFNGDYVVISDSNVAPLYADQFPDALGVLTFPAGERSKTLETVNQFYGQLINLGLDRSGAIVALGGGVVGDMAGFTAASYMRGVKLIQCPTTVLAMVDSSVGGKTGVDLPEGKNLVGAFKQPEAVIVDLDVLQTLDSEQFAAGMAEATKHGLIDNPELFDFIGNAAQTLNADHVLLQNMLIDAVDVKREVVQEDPFEHGRRAQLNLGHTFGHAIEQVSGYAVLHGYGVAMGMVVAARVSAELNHASPLLQTRIEAVLRNLNLPTRIPAHLDPDAIIAAMHSDKKKKAGKLRFILIKEAGTCFITSDVPLALVRKTLLELRAE
ncbi:MAG: 3-dehydroquinate synthase [Candidatus Promineifilaceae bacterium]